MSEDELIFKELSRQAFEKYVQTLINKEDELVKIDILLMWSLGMNRDYIGKMIDVKHNKNLTKNYTEVTKVICEMLGIHTRYELPELTSGTGPHKRNIVTILNSIENINGEFARKRFKATFEGLPENQRAGLFMVHLMLKFGVLATLMEHFNDIFKITFPKLQEPDMKKYLIEHGIIYEWQRWNKKNKQLEYACVVNPLLEPIINKLDQHIDYSDRVLNAAIIPDDHLASQI